MREPVFWWHAPGLSSAMLTPVAAIYGAVAASRMSRQGARAGLPVICVGNFNLGGSGKTPAAIAVAGLLIAAGRRPAFLTRGYGGAMAGPVTVDRLRHTAIDVGDEAMLLAQTAPVIVSRNRVEGAKLARACGADVVVMDDGLQNGSLAKDLRIAVVDGRRGVGNGNVFPAGPLRAPLESQIKAVDALLVIGDISGAADLLSGAQSRGLPVFRARLTPQLAAIEALGGRKVLAFAGIGDPDKFFRTLAAAGIEAAHCQAFADHHRYTAEEAGNLIMRAERDGLRLLTTEKDRARIGGDPDLAGLAQRAHVLPVTLVLDDEPGWRSMIMNAAVVRP